MKKIVDNLNRQHHELVRTATHLFGWLDEHKLAAGAAAAHRLLLALTGILRVHLSMEDRTFYPFLLSHPDESLRALAAKFLDARADLKERFDTYRDRWPTPRAIERDPAGFADETRLILGELWNRMKQEDDVFHPEVVSRWEARN